MREKIVEARVKIALRILKEWEEVPRGDIHKIAQRDWEKKSPLERKKELERRKKAARRYRDYQRGSRRSRRYGSSVRWSAEKDYEQ